VPPSIYVIDTHPLVWYFIDSPRLSTVAKHAFADIEQGNALGIIPTIVLAEMVHLADRRKIPLSINETIAKIRRSTNFGIASLDLTIILLMIPLNTCEIHDRVIIATAQSFGASLITKDEFIHKSEIVSCVW
jgi:PIN domain nuclease of toxin-antitoxin system